MYLVSCMDQIRSGMVQKRKVYLMRISTHRNDLVIIFVNRKPEQNVWYLSRLLCMRTCARF